MRLLLGHDEIVYDLMRSAFPHLVNANLNATIGIAVEDNGSLVGGILVDQKKPFDAHISIFTSSPYLWKRSLIRQFFSFLFNDLGLIRVTAEVLKKNKKSRKMIEGLGFRLEGTLRRGFDGYRDAIVYGMTKDECRWIRKD